MAADKNILLVAYYFPPLGMGGVGRPYSLFRYLPEHNYRVTVLTVKDIVYPGYDHTRLDTADESNIIRSGSYDPSRLMHILGMRKMKSSGGAPPSTSRLYFPDSKCGWVGPAFRAAKRLLKTNNYDAVITTSPPPSAHKIGLKIKSFSGLPWIADFRDFWFSLPIEMIYPTSLQKKYALGLKEKILGQADEIVGVNNSIIKYLGRGETITNGADSETARLWKSENNEKPEKPDYLTIGVLGTINRLCPVEPLFAAVASIMAGGQSPTKQVPKIKIVHVGSYDVPMMASLLDKYRLNNIVTLKGYLPKNEAVSALAPCDLMYFSVAPFDQYHILPGRIFDYLMSAKPIIGCVPDGSDAENMLREYDNGIIITDDNMTMIESYIRGRLENTDEIGTTDGHDCEKYSTKYMARRYAELLNRIIK